MANQDIGRAVLTVMGDGFRSASSSAAKLGHRYATRGTGESEGYKRGGSLRQVRVVGLYRVVVPKISDTSSKCVSGESVISQWQW